ncbi:hypothetical protein ACF1DY_04515 [Streptomyces albus]|uniref:hypothetical protein n=1 Tax=Streptomyces albus TaxID=1888 RepID=UPI0036FC39D6
MGATRCTALVRGHRVVLPYDAHDAHATYTTHEAPAADRQRAGSGPTAEHFGEVVPAAMAARAAEGAPGGDSGSVPGATDIRFREPRRR